MAAATVTVSRENQFRSGRRVSSTTRSRSAERINSVSSFLSELPIKPTNNELFLAGRSLFDVPLTTEYRSSIR
jgi:hypothetical protein